MPPRRNCPKPPRRKRPRRWRAYYLQIGLDGIKLFTGAYKGEDKPVVNMEAAIAKAAVDVAHAQGKPVFAHPQNKAGVETVIAAGVDVMAHTSAGSGLYPRAACALQAAGDRVDADLVAVCKDYRCRRKSSARLVDNVVGQLKSFSDNGNTVLFGTDVGYITLYDTTLEYELMHRALSERQVLASLTTNPAGYFKAAKKGRVERGSTPISWCSTAIRWPMSGTSPRSPTPSVRGR